MKNNKLKLLRSYRDNIAELLDIQQELNESTVCDSVQSSSKFPYSKHSVTIRGVPPDNEIYELQIRAQKLKQDIKDAEHFVNSLPYRLRKAVELYYIDECLERITWEEVARETGFSGGGESLRVKIYNITKSQK